MAKLTVSHYTPEQQHAHNRYLAGREQFKLIVDAAWQAVLEADKPTAQLAATLDPDQVVDGRPVDAVAFRLAFLRDHYRKAIDLALERALAKIAEIPVKPAPPPAPPKVAPVDLNLEFSKYLRSNAQGLAASTPRGKLLTPNR